METYEVLRDLLNRVKKIYEEFKEDDIDQKMYIFELFTLVLEILFNNLSALIESGDKSLMVFIDETNESEKERIENYYSEIL